MIERPNSILRTDGRLEKEPKNVKFSQADGRFDGGIAGDHAIRHIAFEQWTVDCSHYRGEPSDYRAKDVKKVLKKLNVSQAVFAHGPKRAR